MNKFLKSLLLMALLCVPWVTQAQQVQTLTVADGTASSDYVPFQGNWVDAINHSQIIYGDTMLSDMVNQSILSLTFYAGSQNITWSGVTFDVKMIQVDWTPNRFTSQNFIDTTMTTVYSGPVSLVNGQLYIELGTPFLYTGGDLIIDFSQTATGSYNSCYFDGIDYNGAALQGHAYSITDVNPSYKNVLPKVTFSYGTAPNCTRPNSPTFTNVGSDQITFSWTPSGTPTGYIVEYANAPFEVGQGSASFVNDTFVTITNLAAATHYFFAVRAVCGNNVGDTSLALMGDTYTTCVPLSSLPLFYTFDSISDAPMESTSLPICWTRINQSTDSYYADYPYVYDFMGDGNMSLYFYTYNYYVSREYAVLQQFDTNQIAMNNIMLRFRAQGDYVTTMQLGVLTDPEDPSTFVLTDSVRITSTEDWGVYELTTASYEGNGSYLAMRFINSYEQSSSYALVDNIEVVTIPNCTTPAALQGIGSLNGIAISWTPRGEESEWVVAINGTDTISVDEPEYVIENLPSDSCFFIAVAASCDGEYSGFISGTYCTLDREPVTEYPYLCTFDTTAGEHGWEILNGTQPNFWVVDSLNGSLALYITNDSSTNAYTTSNSSSVYATNLFYMEPGDYQISFDWICYGEGSYDYLRALLVPSSVELTPGTQTYNYYSTPSNCIALENNGTKLNDVNSWQNNSALAHIDVANNYRMVLMWTNDGSSGDNPPAAVDNISIVAMPCAQPGNLTYTATTDSLVFSWTSEASSFLVDFNGTTTEVYENTFEASELSAGTQYSFSVRALCNDDTSAVVSINANTQCGYITSLPYTNTFDNYGITSSNYYSPYRFPLCWSRITTYSNYPYLYYNGGVENTTSLYWYSSSSPDFYEVVALPPLDTVAVPVNSVVVSFSAKTTYQTYVSQFAVGVMSDPADYTTFVAVDTVDVTGDMTEFNVPLSNYTDTGMYIAICMLPSNYISVYMDNVTLMRYTSCTRPDSLIATAYTDSVHLSWTPRGEETEWIVSYNDNALVTSTPYTTITGLDPSTQYTFELVAVCGVGDTSAPRSINVRTECTPVADLPYFYGFEDATGEYSSDPSTINPCWKRFSSDQSYTYPYPCNTASTGVKGLCFYGYSNSTWCYATLPTFDVPIDSLMITFKTRRLYEGSYYSSGLSVGVMTDPADRTTFTPIQTVSATNAASWDEFSVYFSGYTGTGRYIAFMTHDDGTSSTNYTVVDDITVDYAPTCPTPDEFHVLQRSAESVTIAWNGHDAPSFNLSYSDGTNTNTLTVTTDTVVLTGLTVATTYTLQITDDCGNNELSLPLNTTFATANAYPGTVPFSCDFTPATSTGWEYAQNQTNKWYVGTLASNGTADSYGLYVSSDNGATYGYNNSVSSTSFAYRTLALPAGNYVYSFDWTGEGESTYDYLRVAIFPTTFNLDPGSSNWSYTNVPAEAVAILDGGIQLNQSNTTWNTVAGEFTIADSGEYNIVFMWRNDASAGTPPPAAVDNVSVSANTCPMVSNVTSISSGATYINVDWTENGTATQWEVEYTNSGVTTTTIVNAHPYNITGLDTASICYVRVRSICAAGDTGMYSNSVSFTTTICDNSTIAQLSNDTSEFTNYNYYFPFYYSGYICMSQTILDSTILGNEALDFEAISYNYIGTEQMPTRHVKMYLQPTTKSEFTSDNDLESVSAQAIKVFEGNFDAVQGWNIYPFDTIFSYDPSTNYNLIVVQDVYNYQWGNYYFNGVQQSTHRSIYGYLYNSGTIDEQYPAFDYSYRPDYCADLRMISCGVSCNAPSDVVATVNDYQSATVSWTGNGSNADYEVAMMAATETAWPDGVTVSATSYDFTNLLPATTYQFRVRAICDATEGLMSDWTMGTFTTDSLPCFAPSNMQMSDVAMNTATFDWTVNGNETAWRIHVWNTTFDQTYDVTTHPATVTGLTKNTQYNAAVMAVCGGGLLESEASDTVTFTTLDCPVPTNVAVSGVTTHTATINWNGTAASYTLEYGSEGYPQGDGTTIANITGNSYELTDLIDGYAYDLYVMANCDAQNSSDWSAKATFTTLVGINGVQGSMVTLYPNPTSNSTTITLSGVNGDVTIAIVDMNGRIVRSETMNCEGDCAKTMQVDDLAQGAYFVRISGDNVNMVKKLVVK